MLFVYACLIITVLRSLTFSDSFIWCASTTTTSHFIFKLRKLSVDGPRGDVTDIELQYSNFPELRSVTTVVGTDSEMKRTQSVEKYTS
jgi:hypothetical protein